MIPHLVVSVAAPGPVISALNESASDGVLVTVVQLLTHRVVLVDVEVVSACVPDGLPAEVADRLFDPYFSTKSKGTGLGLAICRNLADRMGGTITLSNRSDGPGAIAELTLPRKSGEGSVERDPLLS